MRTRHRSFSPCKAVNQSTFLLKTMLGCSAGDDTYRISQFVDSLKRMCTTKYKLARYFVISWLLFE